MPLGNAPTLLTGLENPAFASSQIFRDVLEALSRPGTVVPAPDTLETPGKLNRAATGFLLALADMETPVWISPDLRDEQTDKYLRFHTGCPLTDNCSDAAFAVAHHSSDFSFLSSLAVGSSEMPHQSATLIVMVDGFTGPTAMTLTGPGIQSKATLSPNPIPDVLVHWAQANQRLFPCGVDLIFAASSSLAALPRTTRIEV
ncbi:MAG: phosphonate C-P lyase system protein PhnH [Sneathiella sp.]